MTFLVIQPTQDSESFNVNHRSRKLIKQYKTKKMSYLSHLYKEKSGNIIIYNIILDICTSRTLYLNYFKMLKIGVEILLTLLLIAVSLLSVNCQDGGGLIKMDDTFLFNCFVILFIVIMLIITVLYVYCINKRVKNEKLKENRF